MKCTSDCGAGLQNLCNLIWGMARLAEHPGPELMRKFLQKSEELLDSTDHEGEEERGQGVANTLWALAVLDELRPEFVEQVRKHRRTMAPAPRHQDHPFIDPLLRTAPNLTCGAATALRVQVVW